MAKEDKNYCQLSEVEFSCNDGFSNVTKSATTLSLELEGLKEFKRYKCFARIKNVREFEGTAEFSPHSDEIELKEGSEFSFIYCD